MENKNQQYPREQESKLASIEKRIYSVHNPVSFKDRRSYIHDDTSAVSHEWQDIKEEEKQEVVPKRDGELLKKISRVVFWVAVVLLLVVGTYGGYQIYGSGSTINGNKIGFTIETPGYIDGGVIFPVDVYVTNGNRASMERVDVVIEYPKGESITSKEDTEVKRVALGDVVKGQTAKGETDMVLFGREGNMRNISAYVEYYAPGSSVVRRKDISKTILLRSAPVVITTEHLKEVPSNEEVAYTVNINAERGLDLENFVLTVGYPTGFQYIRASEEPRNGNNTWIFDSIPKGTKKSVTIYGRIRGEDGDERSFRVTGGVQNLWNKGEIGIVYADTKSSIAIKKPFIGITGSFDAPQLQTGEFAIASVKRTKGKITVKNNIQDTVSNVVVSADVSGEVLNRQKIVVNGGFFNSSKNTIIWDQSTYQQLRQLLPGDTVTLDFDIETYPLSAKQNGLFIDPSIKFDVSVKGKRLSDVDVPEVYSAASPLVARVITDATIVTSLMYANSPLPNTGPFPFVREQPTSLTLALEAQNRSNTVNNAFVNIPLLPHVEYAGVYSPENKAVTYNANSRVITWNINTIPAGTGFGRGEEKVYIKLVVTPTIQMSLADVPVTGQIDFGGKDTFTQTDLISYLRQLLVDYRVK